MKKILTIITLLFTSLTPSFAAVATTFIETGTDATQLLSFYSSSSGTVGTATDQQHTGPRSIKLSTGNPAVNVLVDSRAGVLLDSGSQVSWWFRFDTIPAANTNIFFLRTSGSAIQGTLQLKTDGKLTYTPVGATSINGTTVLAINTWYRLCVSFYNTDTTTFRHKIYVDGTLEINAALGTLTRVGADLARFSWLSTAGVDTNAWVDDVYIATGGADSSAQPDTGNIVCTAKRPNANGTTNNFVTQIGSGGSGYGSGHSPQVNEQPATDTNGWSVVAVGSAVTEEYNIEGASTGDVDISSATIVDYMGWLKTKALTTETAQIVINGANQNVALTTVSKIFLLAAGSTTYPAGTGTDIGEITDTTVTTVNLYECGIVFAYTPSTGNTTNFFQFIN